MQILNIFNDILISEYYEMIIKVIPRQSIQLTVRNNAFCDLPVVNPVQVSQ